MTDDELTRRLVDGITERQKLAARSDLLDRREAIAHLGVGRRRFDAEVVAGALPVAYRTRGRKNLFDAEDLDAWLKSQRAGVQSTAPRGTVDLTQDSSPLAEGRARSVKEVSTVPSSPRVPERSPLLDSCIHREEAARYVGLGLRKFGSEVSAGKIPVYRVGRRHLFDPSDLDVYLLTRKYGGAER